MPEYVSHGGNWKPANVSGEVVKKVVEQIEEKVDVSATPQKQSVLQDPVEKPKVKLVEKFKQKSAKKK